MALYCNHLSCWARRLIMSCVAFVLLCASASCESKSRSTAIEEISNRTEHVSHVKHSARLRVVMREINELSLARLPQEMGTSLSQRRRVASIGAIADRLADSASTLPNHVHDLDLTEAQQASFIELAKFLQEEARELGRIARDGASPRLVQAKL